MKWLGEFPLTDELKAMLMGLSAMGARQHERCEHPELLFEWNRPQFFSRGRPTQARNNPEHTPVMRNAGTSDALCKPKALRHAFAVEAGQKDVPLNIVQ
jgi:hypothetical protein